MAGKQRSHEVPQGRENVGAEEESQSSKRNNSSSSESFNWESPLAKLSERLDTLKAKIMNMTYDENPLLIEQEPLPTSEITQNLITLMRESGIGYELPECSFEKVMKMLDNDIEECNLLINSMSEIIEKEQILQEVIDEQRRVVNTLIDDLNKDSDAVPDNITDKVNRKFRHFRQELNDLVALMGEENEEELSTILAELTNSYLNEPGTEGQYVKISGDQDFELIQFLVANRIVIWNDDHTCIKLNM